MNRVVAHSLPEQMVSQLSGARILVTGGAGFMGSHLVRMLVKLGSQVLVADSASKAWRLEELTTDIEYLRLDLSQGADVAEQIAELKPTKIFHLAAYAVQPTDRDPHQAIAVNVHGSAAIVQAAARSGVSRLVQVGTSHEYGGSEVPITEEHVLNPRGIYGATKAAGMIVGRSLAEQLGVPWTGVRPFVTYGPAESEGKLIPYVILRSLRGKPVETTHGRQIRDFLYIKDLVRGLVMASCSDRTIDQVINLGTGNGVPLESVIRLAASFVPDADLRIGARPERNDAIFQQIADMHKTAALLPDWQPEYSLEAGLAETFEWYANRFEQKNGVQPT